MTPDQITSLAQQIGREVAASLLASPVGGRLTRPARLRRLGPLPAPVGPHARREGPGRGPRHPQGPTVIESLAAAGFIVGVLFILLALSRWEGR